MKQVKKYWADCRVYVPNMHTIVSTLALNHAIHIKGYIQCACVMHKPHLISVLFILIVLVSHPANGTEAINLNVKIFTTQIRVGLLMNINEFVLPSICLILS